MKANIITNMKKIKSFDIKRFRLFDVSLRDGLQSQNKIYSLDEKISMFDNIITKYNPNSIEIGSIVNPKILPQMENTIDLFNHVKSKNIDNDIYILTPNIKSVNKALQIGVKNFSLITSMSNVFQWKNINTSLDNTKRNLSIMYDTIQDTNNDNKIKIYLSCVNECPISGKIPIENVINEFLYYYNHYKVEDICLSDTCGTLNHNDLKKIINILIDRYGVEPKKISLHFHTNSENLENIFKMLNIAYNNNIEKLDISCVESGGCNVTINDDNKLKKNMSYDILYQYYILHGKI